MSDIGPYAQNTIPTHDDIRRDTLISAAIAAENDDVSDLVSNWIWDYHDRIAKGLA